MDAFRTFCLSPTPEGRDLLLGIRQFGSPISRPAPHWRACGHDHTGVRRGIDRRPALSTARRELCEHAERQGWQIADIYEDVSSGAKVSRPALNRLIADARAKKFHCLLVWKLDRFGRSPVDCLNNIKMLEENGIRFIAVTQGLDMDLQNPPSRLLLHVLGAAAEFERALIREWTQPGRARYKRDFESGKVGKTVYSRSGRKMPPHRPRTIFDQEEVYQLGRQGRSYRQIATTLGLGPGTVVRTLQERSKSS